MHSPKTKHGPDALPDVAAYGACTPMTCCFVVATRVHPLPALLLGQGETWLGAGHADHRARPAWQHLWGQPCGRQSGHCSSAGPALLCTALTASPVHGCALMLCILYRCMVCIIFCRASELAGACRPRLALLGYCSCVLHGKLYRHAMQPAVMGCGPDAKSKLRSSATAGACGGKAC